MTTHRSSIRKSNRCRTGAPSWRLPKVDIVLLPGQSGQCGTRERSLTSGPFIPFMYGTHTRLASVYVPTRPRVDCHTSTMVTQHITTTRGENVVTLMNDRLLIIWISIFREDAGVHQTAGRGLHRVFVTDNRQDQSTGSRESHIVIQYCRPRQGFAS